MTTAIWWIRRDLRLTDNQALTSALERADQVIPTFIFDPNLLDSPYTGSKRLAFLLEGLHQLAADLENRGGQLIVRRGDPAEELEKLAAETDADVIFAEQDYSPYARRRDERVAEKLPLTLESGLTVYPPGTVLKEDGDPYVVFTPFSKGWKSLPGPDGDDILPAPDQIPTPSGLSSDSIPSEPVRPDEVPFPAGETEAQKRLEGFTQGNEDSPLYGYKKNRNRLDLDATSRLSPYLRFGMVSARQAAVAAQSAIDNAPDDEAAKGARSWLDEVIWREFYIDILHHFPRVRQSNFYQKFDAFPWENDPEQFEAWSQGQTGYPVVDAAMQQLVQSGWMHNRARMIVASFLVKHLLIDWRWGERFFMQHLVDGDPAANNGGWQWTAGSGTDAAPYFRIFNPILQSEKYDPDGEYIRRWIPELADVPSKYIHTPWEMPDEIQEKAGCRIGQDYPEPIVEHKWARERALDAYDQVK